MEIRDDEVVNMMSDTSNLIAQRNASNLANAINTAKVSNSLTNRVEFWKWMDRNYHSSGIFQSNQSMNNYIAQGVGKKDWVMKQLQGKGYEWDWMTKQRNSPIKMFNHYDAGDVANRVASDVTERNMITGNITEYQMKAYTSKTNPNLKNTPKDMTVVTNSEKVGVVRQNGYDNVQSFMDNESIIQATDDRMQDIVEGKATPVYEAGQVIGTIAHAGVIGCVIGMGTESIVSYKNWKNGFIDDDEYITEIMKAGGEGGVTAAATTGVMIPVTAAITAAGVTSVVTIPIAIVVGSALDYVVAPCFGRGKYKEILNKAHYYQNLDSVYDDYIAIAEQAVTEYSDFIDQMIGQKNTYESLKQLSSSSNKRLRNLYDSI